MPGVNWVLLQLNFQFVQKKKERIGAGCCDDLYMVFLLVSKLYVIQEPGVTKLIECRCIRNMQLHEFSMHVVHM